MAATVIAAAPCGYPTHRWADWRKPGGRWVCGVCHSPAVTDVELRTPGAPVLSSGEALAALEAAKRGRVACECGADATEPCPGEPFPCSRPTG